MADEQNKDVDQVSGVETTGHQWDGIKELNNPLPKWWLYTFYVTIIWTIGFTIAFPAWPFVEGATKGLLGYTTRGELAEIVAEAEAAQAPFKDRIAALPIEDVADDAELLQFAQASGASTFRTYCSQCHGSGAAGGIGYPNLNDDDWLWGGTQDAIYLTIAHGIRQTDEEGYATDDTRDNAMPAYGRDELLEEAEIAAVVEYVLSLSGQEHDAAQLDTGAVIFEENCAACHGDAGEGIQDLGAPNLADAIWLYGGDRNAVTYSVVNARAGMMPAWSPRLDDATVKAVALYVHSLGGGE
ncbi:MAG: cytochrome-c oxidase, cbb3-type subunit III [Pseudomonadota bacterium]